MASGGPHSYAHPTTACASLQTPALRHKSFSKQGCEDIQHTAPYLALSTGLTAGDETPICKNSGGGGGRVKIVGGALSAPEAVRGVGWMVIALAAAC